MQKIVLAILVVMLFIICGCAGKTADGTPGQSNPTTINGPEQPTDPVNTDEWAEFSDYELMEMTMASSQNEFRQFSAVWMTAEEWKDYMLENCEPLKALMLRDTAMESLEEHTQTVIDQYQGDLASMRSENFALLAMTLHPQMEELLQDIEISYPPKTGTE